ncbi:DUF4885 family protein [Peptostreptococcaceae bacterium AGR-M142]
MNIKTSSNYLINNNSNYKLEGRTKDNVYKGESDKLRKDMIKYYEKENIRNKHFSDPEEHIRRKYFDPNYQYYKGGADLKRLNGYSNEMRMLKKGEVSHYSPYDYCFDGKIPKIDTEVERHREHIYNRLQMDNQLSKLFEANNIKMNEDITLTFRTNLYTKDFEVLGLDDLMLKDKIEKILNQDGNKDILFEHMMQSMNHVNSLQVDSEKTSLRRLAKEVHEHSGYDVRNLEARDGSFYTKDGENVLDKVLQNIREETKGNTPREQAAAISSAVELFQKWSEKGIPKEEQYYDIEYKNGNLLDIKQSKKYGVGQNKWIHDLAKQAGVSDYEITKDGLKLIGKEIFSESSIYDNPYDNSMSNNKEGNKNKQELLKDFLDEFLWRKNIALEKGTNLNILFNSSKKHFIVYGLKDEKMLNEINRIMNEDENLIDMFMRFSAKRDFSMMV